MKNDLICNILPRKHSLQNKDHIFDEAQYNFYSRKYRDLCTSKNLKNYIKLTDTGESGPKCAV